MIKPVIMRNASIHARMVAWIVEEVPNAYHKTIEPIVFARLVRKEIH